MNLGKNMSSSLLLIKNSPIYRSAARTVRNVKQHGLNLLPATELSNTKLIDKISDIGKYFSSDKQRLALGLTALITQPFIDYNNKDVDEKTRKISVARTIAKIIAGTLTGFAIRYGCIKGIKALSQIPGKGVPKWKTIFTPEGIKDNTTEAFAQYRNAMGTVVALVIMMFTNFLIDAPLTKFLTNFFVKKQGGEK